MKIRNLTLLLFVCLSAGFSGRAGDWTPDILEGYLKQTIEMPDDYQGRVVSTVVKKNVGERQSAILYLHGYNDYFFQSALGDSIVAHGYGFYALDLRKYGRSILPGQRPFQVRNLKEYFADVDAALSVMEREGVERVVLMAHSTGGLILSYYLTELEAGRPMVKALILNSPFLDMNLSKFQEKFLVPVVSFLPFKKINISQGDSRAYAESLLAKYHGEWDYDTSWKFEVSPDVTTGWITAIHKAQKHVRKHADIQVPVLLLHSDKSVYGQVWTPAFNSGDAVLDVDDISKYGKMLGGNVTEVVIPDGLHDLVLSRGDVRDVVYQTVFSWLQGI